MKYLEYIWYALTYRNPRDYDARKTVRKHVAEMRSSGYTKRLFDVDGHTVVIQSHKHVDDFSA